MTGFVVLVHTLLIVQMVSAKVHGPDTFAVECAGHHCHHDEVCWHEVHHIDLRSHCKKFQEIQHQHAAPCTSVPTEHNPCYCETNDCNLKVYNQIYQQNHVNQNNVELKCGDHSCFGHEKCRIEENPEGHIHLRCDHEVHNMVHCLPNLLNRGSTCICDSRACVEQTLISLVAGHQVSGVICSDHDDHVCHATDVCVITHEKNGHYKKHCGHEEHLMTECFSLPRIHEKCFCKTQDCVYGRFTVTTNNPTTAQMGSTHYQVATQNQTLPVTSVSGQQSTTGASTSTSKPTTLGLSNTTSTTTQIPVQTATLPCADDEDHNFTCSNYETQFNMCSAKKGTLFDIAHKRCRQFCGICGSAGSTGSIVGSGSTTGPIVCMDHDSRCRLFSQQICSPSVSHSYVISTCAKTCNVCKEYLDSLLAQKKAKCMVCGDHDAGIPCSLQDVYENSTTVQECPVGFDYCMTDMHRDGNNNQDVFKRCVTKSTCEQKWLKESADLDYCYKYGLVANHNPHECHFCCQGEACNSAVKPSDQTLVPKP